MKKQLAEKTKITLLKDIWDKEVNDYFTIRSVHRMTSSVIRFPCFERREVYTFDLVRQQLVATAPLKLQGSGS